jgi:beta-glucanase (GH16 family)
MTRRKELFIFGITGIIILALFTYNLYAAHFLSAQREAVENVCTMNCAHSHLAVSAKSPTPSPTSSDQNPSIAGYKLTWDDEFNETQLDTSKWYAVDSQGGKDQQGCCLNYSYNTLTSPNQLQIHDGMLTITTKRSTSGGPLYQTGAITTETLTDTPTFTFTYGKIDIRAKLPAGNGVWPAMWLLTGPATSPAAYEIDMMEMLGQDPHTIYMVVHHYDGRYYCTYKGPDFSQSFHDFTLDWEPGRLSWSIDGQVLCTTTSYVPTQPMYLILNTALSDGSWGDIVTGSTPLPQTFDIDYVRIYTKE